MNVDYFVNYNETQMTIVTLQLMDYSQGSLGIFNLSVETKVINWVLIKSSHSSLMDEFNEKMKTKKHIYACILNVRKKIL